MEDQRTHERYAAKFFLTDLAHKLELDLYTDKASPLGQFLPMMLKCADPGDIVGPNGSPMPACIVMEKGEAMDVWIAQTGDLDTFGGLQVSVSPACCKIGMHARTWWHDVVLA